MEQAIRAKLINASTIAGSRIYPMNLPLNAVYPAIVYQLISEIPTTSNDGDSKLDVMRLQLRSWGKTYAESKNLASQVKSTLNAISDRPKIQSCFLANANDFYDADTQKHSVIQDYIVTYKGEI